MSQNTPPNGTATDLVASGADAVSGLAVFGKTAAALLLIIALILLCSYLLRRFAPGGMLPRHLRLVSSLAVGNKERVVIVAVDDTWLVLGVGGGQVNKLHELPAREEFRSQLEKASRHPAGGHSMAEQPLQPHSSPPPTEQAESHSRRDCAPTNNGVHL